MKIAFIILSILVASLLAVILGIMAIKWDMKNEFTSVWNKGNYDEYHMEITNVLIDRHHFVLFRGTIRDDHGIDSGNCTWSLRPFRRVHLLID